MPGPKCRSIFQIIMICPKITEILFDRKKLVLKREVEALKDLSR